jgi:tricarballylate dehydrogenase
LRCAHAAPTEFLTGAYPEDEYLSELWRVTGGQTNEELARMAIRESPNCFPWMRGYGVRFQPSLSGTLQLDRTNLFFLGGGKALLNSYYAAAERRGIRVLYEAEVAGLTTVAGRFESADVWVRGEPVAIRAKAFVAATGGFESNLEWLKEAWGEAADNFLIRGTPYNQGKVLRLLLDQGAEAVGDPRQCHAVAIDARAPKFDGGIVTRLDCVPLGIVVNQKGERFYDEGEDLWPKRYAIWGRLVADQPGQIAYSIIDSKAIGSFMPSVFPAIRADTIPELAMNLGLSPDALAGTVDRFNRAVRPGKFDRDQLDDCHTRGLAPEKSHWARTIDTPPFLGYPLRPGITFTYLGVKVSPKACLLMQDGRPANNIFAAGEIMAGNILGKGYLGGLGMLIGTVFGRVAGTEAARCACRT